MREDPLPANRLSPKRPDDLAGDWRFYVFNGQL